ncbi:hypothetical protein BLNAU_8389 [Blattamonas nauphoetae]|uniref:WD40 repeat-like protein n=1 Tax=Blattamonas nauphoetae TaxID=2049346 RepID=A0ABQ9XYI7_9EUKA|nr:hypothetical protein BLNAU_8389 [Blattamonas nauphoetae]
MADPELSNFQNVFEQIHHWESNITLLFQREHAQRQQSEGEIHTMRLQLEQIISELNTTKVKLKEAEQENHNLTCDQLMLKTQLNDQRKMTELMMNTADGTGTVNTFNDMATVKNMNPLSSIIRQTLQDKLSSSSTQVANESGIQGLLDDITDSLCKAISKQTPTTVAMTQRSSSPTPFSSSDPNLSLDHRASGTTLSLQTMCEWMRDIDEDTSTSFSEQINKQLELCFNKFLHTTKTAPSTIQIPQLVAHNMLPALFHTITAENPTRQVSASKPSLSPQHPIEPNPQNEQPSSLFRVALRVLSFFLSMTNSQPSQNTPTLSSDILHLIARFLLSSAIPTQLINAFCHLVVNSQTLSPTGMSKADVPNQPPSTETEDFILILQQILVVFLQTLLFATSQPRLFRFAQFDQIKLLFAQSVFMNISHPSIIILLLCCLLQYQSYTIASQQMSPFPGQQNTSSSLFATKISTTSIPQVVSVLKFSSDGLQCLAQPSNTSQPTLNWKQLAASLARGVELDSETIRKEEQSISLRTTIIEPADINLVKAWMTPLLSSWELSSEEVSTTINTIQQCIETTASISSNTDANRTTQSDTSHQSSGITVLDKSIYIAFNRPTPPISSLTHSPINPFSLPTGAPPSSSPDMSDSSQGDRLFSSQNVSHNLPSFKTSISLQNHLSAVRALSAHPTRLSFLSAGDDGILRFWDFSSFAYRQSRIDSQTPFILSRAAAPILATRFLARRREAISATSKGQLSISAIPSSFDYTSDGAHHKLNSLNTFTLHSAHRDAICAVDATNDEKAIVTCSADGMVKIWVFQNDEGASIRDYDGRAVKEWEWDERRKAEGEWTSVSDRLGALSPTPTNTPSLYTGQRDEQAERAMTHPIYNQPLHAEPDPLIHALSISHPQGIRPTGALFNPINHNQLFIGYRNGDLAEFDLHQTKRVSLLTHQHYSKDNDSRSSGTPSLLGQGGRQTASVGKGDTSHWITSMSFSSQNGRLLLSNKNSRVSMIDTTTLTPTFSIGQAMSEGISCLDWSSDPNVFSVCSYVNEMKLFDLRRVRHSHMLVRTTHKQYFGNGITSIQFHRVYPLCVVGGADSTLKVFVTPTESEEVPNYVASNNRRLKEIREKEKVLQKQSSQRGDQQRKQRSFSSKHG